MVQSITTTTTTGKSASPIIPKRKRTIRVHRPLPRHQSNTTKEEEDIANCFVLLSQGRFFTAKEATKPPPPAERCTNFNFYHCKTCNKSFASIQALGGHCASHKKAKITPLEAEMSKTVASSSNNSGVKQRTHDCLRCGLEFPSGQALGGHMRKHWNFQVEKKQKGVFLIDLNLPAPNDDESFGAGN